MKVTTEARIDALVADLKPVKRLLGPSVAAWAGWAAGALAAGLGLAAIGPRPDLADAAGSLRFWIAVLAPPATAWAALRWALELATPGRSAGGAFAFLTGVSGAVWIAGLGSGADFGPVGAGACAIAELVLAIVPALAFSWMLLARASVRPAASLFALAVAALALGLAAIEWHCGASEWGHRLIQHGLPVILVPAVISSAGPLFMGRRR